MMHVSDIARLALEHPEMERKFAAMKEPTRDTVARMGKAMKDLHQLLVEYPDAVVIGHHKGYDAGTCTPLQEVRYDPPENNGGVGCIVLIFA